MKWCFEEDHTPPVLSTKAHIQHIKAKKGWKMDARFSLPERAVVFCLGRGIPVLRERFDTKQIMEELPAFIHQVPVYGVAGHEDVCFLDGGRGAPQAASAGDTLHALGVKEVLVVGLCGAFGEEIQVCDLLIPEKILSEEGASQHYFPQVDWAAPEPIWSREELRAFFAGKGLRLQPGNTVTTDGVYRQTFFKEAMWREKGCVAVDMEASAFVSVCNYYGMRSQVVLMASDRHPLSENSPPWKWGNVDFQWARDHMIEASIALALNYPAKPMA